MRYRDLKVGDSYTLHFIPTFTGNFPSQKAKCIQKEIFEDKTKSLAWFKTNEGVSKIKASDIPKRVTTLLTHKELGDSNVIINNSLKSISEYLKSKSAHTWGQGAICDKFYLLSHGSPLHKDHKRVAIICSIENYNKVKSL